MTTRLARFATLTALLAAALPLASLAGTSAPPPARIVRLDPRLDRLVPREAVLEKLAGGFAWVEGPVWLRARGGLLFSDIPKNLTADTAIYRIRLATRGAGFGRGPAAAAVACHASEAAASYRVTFYSAWTAETHPDGFPASAHFSDLIGATHRPTWTPWAVGAIASAGIERMAEAGKSRPLADEVRAAIKAGEAGAWIAGDGIKRLPGRVGLDLRVTREFPLISLVSMLAPSPDWFVGVAGLDLCEGHRWLAERTVPLYAYDAGTDSGATYEAADADTQPREPVRRLEGPPFRVSGELRPVGSLTVIRR